MSTNSDCSNWSKCSLPLIFSLIWWSACSCNSNKHYFWMQLYITCRHVSVTLYKYYVSLLGCFGLIQHVVILIALPGIAEIECGFSWNIWETVPTCCIANKLSTYLQMQHYTFHHISQRFSLCRSCSKTPLRLVRTWRVSITPSIQAYKSYLSWLFIGIPDIIFPPQNLKHIINIYDVN